jgi:hypothetical protein
MRALLIAGTGMSRFRKSKLSPLSLDDDGHPTLQGSG